MRGFYLAPWWWFLMRGGKRFSLRRTLGLTIGIALLTELLVAGARYAFGGDHSAPIDAFPVCRRAAVIAALALTCEPLLFVVRDSLAGRALRTSVLRTTTFGFTVWCAAVCTALTYRFAPEIPVLVRVRESLAHATDPRDALLRFVIGAFVIWLPVLFVLRSVAIAADGATLYLRPDFTRGPRPQPHQPFEVPPTIGPSATIPGRIPSPGRIVAKRVDPIRGSDRN